MFQSEFSSTNSAPMLFLADDMESIYYVKYIHEAIPKEFNYLIYELVCNKLALHFEIPSPDVALVEIIKGSFNDSELRRNSNHVVPGVIAFGSKDIGMNDIVDKGRTIIDSKHTFKRLKNPLDLVKICIFDLHIENIDRSEANFNLLLKKEGKTDEFVAIDNYAAFGGPLGNLEPHLVNFIPNNIFKSQLFLSIYQYLDKSDIEATIDNYFNKCNSQISNLVKDVFLQLPESWDFTPGLDDKIIDFLLNSKRLDSIKIAIEDFLRFLQNR